MNKLLPIILNTDTHELILFIIAIFPWFFGLAMILTLIHEKYSNWLWKGMSDEKRYFYIKASKW